MAAVPMWQRLSAGPTAPVSYRMAVRVPVRTGVLVRSVINRRCGGADSQERKRRSKSKSRSHSGSRSGRKSEAHPADINPLLFAEIGEDANQAGPFQPSPRFGPADIGPPPPLPLAQASPLRRSRSSRSSLKVHASRSPRGDLSDLRGLGDLDEYNQALQGNAWPELAEPGDLDYGPIAQPGLSEIRPPADIFGFPELRPPPEQLGPPPGPIPLPAPRRPLLRPPPVPRPRPIAAPFPPGPRLAPDAAFQGLPLPIVPPRPPAPVGPRIKRGVPGFVMAEPLFRRLRGKRPLVARPPLLPEQRIKRALNDPLNVEREEKELERYLREVQQIEPTLVVRQSTIPNAGLGLFTTNRAIRKGEAMSEYRGFVYQGPAGKAQFHRKYGTEREIVAPYALYVTRNDEIIDPSQDPTDVDHYTVAQYANDCLGSTNRYMRDVVPPPRPPACRSNNAVFRETRHWHVFLVAERDIGPNQEIFAPYGPNYWGSPRMQVVKVLYDFLLDWYWADMRANPKRGKTWFSAAQLLTNPQVYARLQSVWGTSARIRSLEKVRDALRLSPSIFAKTTRKGLVESDETENEEDDPAKLWKIQQKINQYTAYLTAGPMLRGYFRRVKKPPKKKEYVYRLSGFAPGARVPVYEPPPQKPHARMKVSIPAPAAPAPAPARKRKRRRRRHMIGR
jgi:hypothetical protein